MNKKNKSALSHYDRRYFNWQEDQNLFGAIANKFMFSNFIKENSRVLDFGCSAGNYLKQFENIERYGVEVNNIARALAIKNKIICFNSSDKLPQNHFDQIISNHVLEHTENPLQELKNLYKSLMPGGSICIVVPLDTKYSKYKENDINYELFTWSPMNMGNLLNCAGFRVLESKTIFHKWVPYYRTIVRLFGWKVFHLLSRIWSFINRSNYQVRAIAIKPY